MRIVVAAGTLELLDVNGDSLTPCVSKSPKMWAPAASSGSARIS